MRAAVDILKTLKDHDFALFGTSDVVTLTGLSHSAASKALSRLAAKGLLRTLKRGLWASTWKDIDPLQAIPSLTAPWPSYASLYTALSRHGIVEEIPQTLYAVSASRAARYTTPLGNYRIHHLPARLLWGFEMVQTSAGNFPMAEAEKAFLDLAYLGLIPRSGLGMPYQRDGRWRLDNRKLTRYARRFAFPPLTAYLKKIRLWKV
jgi:predicted transcriptional regulator of viral defense system